MNKTLLTILLAIFVGFCNAQEYSFSPPDYEQIEKNISDENSEYYYPKLLAMIDTSNQTLTIEHYRHLYYGHAFKDSYNPYQSDADETLLPYYQLESMTDTERIKFFELANQELLKNPVDMRTINFMAYIYHTMGNEEMASRLYDRFYMTLSAVLSTGDGQTCETAYHVLYISHEYVFMNLFEFNLEMQSLVNGNKCSCDYLKFQENPKNVSGVYFNIDRPMATLNGF